MAVLERWTSGIARRLGYEMIPAWRLESRDFADHLRALFAQERIDCVADVGANVGQYRDFLRVHVGYKGRIVSFEPISELAEILERRARSDSGWEVVPCALGAEDTQLDINVAVRSTFSSFLEPDLRQTDKFGDTNRVVRRESVRMRRLDDIADEIEALRTARDIYLKCDTQGFDMQVIAGAKGILPRVSAMQSELSVLGIYKGMPDYLVTLNAMRELGFDPTGMFPVSRDEALRVVEFDCVAVNRSRLPVQAATACSSS